MKKITDLLQNVQFISLACVMVLGLITVVGCNSSHHDNDNDDCQPPDLSTVPADSIVDMNNFVSGGQVMAPVTVTWSGGKRVLQIYLDGDLIYPEPPESEHKSRCPGVQIPLASGYYEFKIWIPGAHTPEKCVWVYVLDSIANIFEEGLQFDIDKWITVPGDGCLPIIPDYQTEYAKYVYVDNSNPSYSKLVTDGETLKAESQQSSNSTVDVDNFSGEDVSQNIAVVWEGESDYTLQVYLDGEVVKEEEYCHSGLVIHLAPGYYELKVWDLKTGTFRNVWVNVVGDLGVEEEDEKYIIHTITYLEKQDPKTSQGEHTASYFFQIPSFSTGITVEGGLFIWVGDEDVRLDFGTAFQLIVDEDDDNFGRLFYWCGQGWIDSGKKIEPVNGFFYKATFIVNVEDNDATIIFQDKEETFVFNDVFSETPKDDSWTPNTVARLQAECISKDGIRHAINFKDFSWEHYF